MDVKAKWNRAGHPPALVEHALADPPIMQARPSSSKKNQNLTPQRNEICVRPCGAPRLCRDVSQFGSGSDAILRKEMTGPDADVGSAANFAFFRSRQKRLTLWPGRPNDQNATRGDDSPPKNGAFPKARKQNTGLSRAASPQRNIGLWGRKPPLWQAPPVHRAPPGDVALGASASTSPARPFVAQVEAQVCV